MKISIVIPSIPERTHWLDRVYPIYCETTEDAECLIVTGYDTCNAAWNAGIEDARGDYILLAADDLEPTPGWADVAMEWADSDILPCPRVLNADGSLQSCGSDATEQDTGTPSEVCRVPFLRHEWLEWAYPIPSWQYFGDYWLTRQGRRNGIQTQVVREFTMIHHMAPEGRRDSFAQDLAAYNLAP